MGHTLKFFFSLGVLRNLIITIEKIEDRILALSSIKFEEFLQKAGGFLSTDSIDYI